MDPDPDGSPDASTNAERRARVADICKEERKRRKGRI